MNRNRFDPRRWAGRDMNERDLQILALREQGYSFREIAERVKNENTGELGISTNAASAAHFYALARKPRYERQQEKAPKIAYVRSICQILMDESRYIHPSEIA